jgi:hypothetical protein
MSIITNFDKSILGKRYIKGGINFKNNIELTDTLTNEIVDNYFIEDTLTATFTANDNLQYDNVVADITINLINNKIVILNIPSITISFKTGSTAILVTSTSTLLPSTYRPSETKYQIFTSYNNNTIESVGMCTLLTTGQFKFYTNIQQTTGYGTQLNNNGILFPFTFIYEIGS